MSLNLTAVGIGMVYGIASAEEVVVKPAYLALFGSVEVRRGKEALIEQDVNASFILCVRWYKLPLHSLL